MKFGWWSPVRYEEALRGELDVNLLDSHGLGCLHKCIKKCCVKYFEPLLEAGFCLPSTRTMIFDSMLFPSRLVLFLAFACLCSCASYTPFRGDAVYRDDARGKMCGRHRVPLVSVKAYTLDNPKTILCSSDKRQALDAAFPNGIPIDCYLEPGQYYTTPTQIDYCVECERMIEKGL